MTPPIILAAEAREGFSVPGAESFYGPPIVDIGLFGDLLDINRTVIIMLMATAIVIILFTLAFAQPKLVPRGFQNAMEFGIDFVRNQIIMPTMGPSGMAYLPYLTTLFFFIFFCNLFEVIPFVSFPATSRIGVPLALAAISWLLYIGAGIRAQGGWGYLKNSLVPPGVPKPILIMLVPLEFVSVFIIRPVTLTLRLTFNLLVGHLLLVVLFLGTAYLVEGLTFTTPFGIGTVLLGTAMVSFEIFVAGLQAFVFAILTSVYIAGSKAPAH